MSSRSEREFELWKKWKETGDDRYAQELLESLKPLIMSEVSKYYGVRIPREAIVGEAYRLAYEAISRYDPSAGTAIGTWVVQWLRKLQRFVIQHQNVARIPEKAVSDITTYKNALDELREALGRDPSMDELATHLGWPLSKVQRMHSLLIRDILVPEFAGTDEETLPTYRPSAMTNLSQDIESLYALLSPEEQRIFEGLTGFPSGKPKPLTQIAREMGLSYEEATKIKRSLETKTRDFFFSRSAYGF